MVNESRRHRWIPSDDFKLSNPLGDHVRLTTQHSPLTSYPSTPSPRHAVTPSGCGFGRLSICLQVVWGSYRSERGNVAAWTGNYGIAWCQWSRQDNAH